MSALILVWNKVKSQHTRKKKLEKSQYIKLYFRINVNKTHRKSKKSSYLSPKNRGDFQEYVSLKG